MRSEEVSMQARSLVLLGAALLLGATPAPQDPLPASAPPSLTVSVGVQREVVRLDAAGRPTTTLEPVTETSPGDVLVYRLRATNVGLAPAHDARIDDPIPAGTVLVRESLPGTARRLQASVDGGKTWQAYPATVSHRRQDGAIVQVPAPAEAYTHLRFHLEGALPPGRSAEVGFKVKVQ
jgi:uncharacterized repeat protein (TIGR01451 family)